MKSTLVIAASIIAAVRLARDELQAVEWYRKAAKQGHIEARFDLGLCHSDGAGNLDEDYEQGYQGSNDGKEMATGFECRRRSSLVERSVETPTLSHGITVSQKQSSSVFNQLSQSRLDRVLGSRRAAVSGVEEDA